MVNNGKPEAVGFPPISWEEEALATRPLPLHELPVQVGIDMAMAQQRFADAGGDSGPLRAFQWFAPGGPEHAAIGAEEALVATLGVARPPMSLLFEAIVIRLDELADATAALGV